MMSDFSKAELCFLRGAIDAVLRGSGLQYAAIASACDVKIAAALAGLMDEKIGVDAQSAVEQHAGD